MIKATEQDIKAARKWLSYQSNPVGFEKEVLGVKHVWPKMQDVIESVWTHQLTAVPASHSVSKTFGAANLAVCFKSVFNPSTVITTAPSETLVKNQLWREIRVAYHGSRVPLRGNITTLGWNCVPAKHILAALPPGERGQWEMNFMMGFSTTPDTVSEHATKVQGFHNKWILIIIDEAAGVHPLIWKAILDSLIINERCKVLAIGNPTDPYCKFAEICKPGSGWNVVNISVRDTPNYKANPDPVKDIIKKLKSGEEYKDVEVVPNVAGKLQEARIIMEYGENSNEHKIRCLGQFPDFAEGVVWGPEFAALDKKNHIGDFPWEQTAPVYTFGDYGPIYTAIGFFQFIGDTIRMIDYFYDDIGIGVPGICKHFDRMPYNYAKHEAHWCGPDYHQKHGSNRKSIGTGQTVLSDFKRLGYSLSCCHPHLVKEGIQITRSVIPLMRIGYECTDFVDSIRQYKFKKNLAYSTDSKPAYAKTPQENHPSNHPADMLRHLSYIFRNQLTVDGSRIGYPQVNIPIDNYDPYKHNPLNFARAR